MFAHYAGELRGVPCYILDERWRETVQSCAWTLGRRIFFRTEEDMADPEVYLHELEHIRQMDLVGPLFPLVYMVFNVIYGYDDNPFEIRAREAAVET